MESLRGIAACMVAASHSLNVIHGSGWQSSVLTFSPYMTNAHGAVILFFVLSGYVLGLSLRKQSGALVPLLIQYSVKRVFRICPALFFSIILVVGYLHWFGPAGSHAAATDWFSPFLRSIPSLREIVLNLLLRSQSLNCVTWTLRVELICSLVLPFLYAISQRFSHTTKLALLGALIMLAFIGPRQWMHFLYLFYIGYLLPELSEFFRQCASKPVAKAAVLALAFALFFGSIAVPIGSRAVELCKGTASAALIGLIAFGGATSVFHVLDFRPIRFLGSVSYSFYLVHFIFLFGLSELAFQTVPAHFLIRYALPSSLMLTIVSIVVAAIFSGWSYKYVEQPGIALAKWFFLKTPNNQQPLIVPRLVEKASPTDAR